MTETILTSVIDKLVQLLIEEAKIFKGAYRDVENLKKELELIHSLFKDADTRLEKRETMSETFRAWLKQLREVAYHIEDVIDDYVLHVAQHDRDRRQSGFVDLVRRIARQIRALKPCYSIKAQIQDIQASLGEIKERGVTYGLRPFEGGLSRRVVDENVDERVVHDPRLASLFVGETELVGIDSKRDDLVRRLIGGESTRTVISLVGEGGLGKTTLAKLVYDNEDVKAQFDVCAWINVSQSYNTMNLLRSLTMQICPAATECISGGELDALQNLISLLRQSLQTKRYVVVFDDVWNIDLWQVVKLALPSHNNGSRILITTQNETVAASCKEATSCDFVLKIKPLSQEMAWELFTKKAFRYEYGGRHCPPE